MDGIGKFYQNKLFEQHKMGKSHNVGSSEFTVRV